MDKTIRLALDDMLLEGLPDLVSPADLAGRLTAGSAGTRGLSSAVGRWLRSVGAVRHTRYTAPGRQPLTLWSLRDHDAYRDMGPAARLAAHSEGGR